jgi:hypothetical protein
MSKETECEATCYVSVDLVQVFRRAAAAYEKMIIFIERHRWS